MYLLRWCNALPLLLTAVSIKTEVVYPSPEPQETESSYWYEHGRKELEEALQKPKVTNVAKNVIMFLGDGMGITVGTAGRIFKGQKQGKSGEEGFLVWDRFPNVALVKTSRCNAPAITPEPYTIKCTEPCCAHSCTVCYT